MLRQLFCRHVYEKTNMEGLVKRGNLLGITMYVTTEFKCSKCDKIINRESCSAANVKDFKLRHPNWEDTFKDAPWTYKNGKPIK